MKLILIFFLIFELICVIYIGIVFISLNQNQSIKIYKNHCITKILVVIPAHNECVQIRDTIRALKKANYPKELINIILLNDKCTDSTVDIAYEENVKVCNFYNNENTKGSVLSSFCFQYKKMIENFDYLCIIDADTIIEPNFFMVADNEFKNGHEIVQGEINSIKYNKNIVSCFMDLIQLIINYCTNYQSKLKRTVMIAGKGLLISPRVLDKINWDCKALLDDVDFSFNAIINGYFIHYCPDMKVKTKQVYTLQDMWIQQRRYASGQKQIIKKYHHFLTNKKLLGTSKMYIKECYFNIILFFLLMISIINIRTYLSILISFYICTSIIVAIIIKKEEMKIQNINSILSILLFPFMLLCWHYIYIYSFLFPEKRWKQVRNKY